MSAKKLGFDRECFKRLERLVTPDGIDILSRKHVMIFGLGGVGSWAAEAIARSAIGSITIVDFDVVASTNINRQLPAGHDTIGTSKVEVMTGRLSDICPSARVRGLNIRLTTENIPQFFEKKVDYVIDAIDDVPAKCALINYCYRNDIKLVVSFGAGGRLDPSAIKVTDLAGTRVDRLGRAVRRRLRDEYGFPDGPFGIKAVWSEEIPREPFVFDDDVFKKKNKDLPFGTACFITSVFGMFCASVVCREFLSGLKL
ncbi:MAG: tRNA threonylcarbamoyladenosine dehydratase [Oligoflexales bacterium]|nr:tRNA threonylcarbamoyladenosine dehydratase [Oligoflexales bacterium]